MRYYHMLIFTSLLLMVFQCNKYTHSACINSKVTQFKSQACSTGARVKEYSFQNQIVYSFDPGLCGGDLATYILSEDCDTLGFLGGFTGNTNINGVPFSIAVFRGTVWNN
ncbi:MAG: DUF6970 domain-containing protein [Bacteroidota bacterium]